MTDAATNESPADALNSASIETTQENRQKTVEETVAANPIVAKINQRLPIWAVLIIVFILIFVMYCIYRIFIVRELIGEFVDPNKNERYVFIQHIFGHDHVDYYPDANHLIKYTMKKIDEHIFVIEDFRRIVVWFNDAVTFYDLDDPTKSLGFAKKIT